MNWTDRRRRFRAILKGDCCYHPGSVFDPLSARIAQDLGFEVGMFAGSTASLTVLGAPDLILITLSEFAGQAYRINRAFDLPLLVDADHAYGNALNVMRTVQELETAGVSALTIEDTVLPRPHRPRIDLDRGRRRQDACRARRAAGP
jgi:oxaloacetate decarboxylase